MPFPEVESVHYNKQQLERVICQIRFPTVLKIDTDTPVNFQEKIRSIYPQFEETSEVFFELDTNAKSQLQQDFSQILRPPESKNYAFTSKDEIWHVNLNKVFFSLTTKKYDTWNDFKDRLVFVFDSLNEAYNPNLFTRVGLRYIDVIKRSSLAMEGNEWKELLNEHIIGSLSSDEIKNNISNYENRFRIRLNNEMGNARVLSRTVREIKSGESCFMLDFDLYQVGKFDQKYVFNTLEALHSKAYSIFRWCVKDKLHYAMEPR
jgi:uncharacterized protein (TIGR04255 family)